VCHSMVDRPLHLLLLLEIECSPVVDSVQVSAVVPVDTVLQALLEVGVADSHMEWPPRAETYSDYPPQPVVLAVCSLVAHSSVHHPLNLASFNSVLCLNLAVSEVEAAHFSVQVGVQLPPMILMLTSH
jgi:hypothetical protein